MNNRKTGTILSLLFLPLMVLGLIWLLPNTIQAQEQNGIQVPTTGDIVSGIVIIEGSAWDSDFLRYELAFYQESRPGADWIVFAQGDQVVRNGTLAVWDTTVGYPHSPVFRDGRYQLRLRVVRNDYNYDEYFVSELLIANENGTATPTNNITATLAADLTPLSGTALAATARAGIQVIPSLTPFPTPSAPALPDGEPLNSQIARGNLEASNQNGLLDRLMGVDTSRFGRAFWSGVRIAAYIFAGLAAYWLLRGFIRWIRRYFHRMGHD